MPVMAKKIEDFNCPICSSPDFYECHKSVTIPAGEVENKPTHFSCAGCTIIFMNPTEFGRRHTKTN